ncbi:MAG: transketolase [Bacteroidota bacterium]|nr:transketolase [Bacteroidota bacterium]
MHKLEKIATQVRRDILRMVTNAKSGHPGGSIGCADFLTVLYFDHLNINPKNFTMDGAGEDIFFLSNGHLSPLWYSVLARRGFFTVEELKTFRIYGSRLQGHPTNHNNLAGIRIASGSLGQGISNAAGAALSKKLNEDSGIIYSLHGDGELQEGQNWEALMFAAQHKIDNMIITIDYNKKQIDGSIDDVVSLGNLKNKIDSFGWITLEMDGHNIPEISKTLKKAVDMTGNKKPICIIMNSTMGKGVDFMEDDHKWHGSPLSEEQLAEALTQLDETIGDF